MRTTMKAIAFAAFVLFFALPSLAQTTHVPLGGGSASSAVSSSGGGGGSGGYGGGVAEGFATSTIHTLYGSALYKPRYEYAHGSTSDFAPSRFLAYDEAVKLGQSIIDAKPRSIVEVAAETRAARKHSAPQAQAN